MRTKILDTATLTLYRQRRQTLVSRINARSLSEIATTVITAEEQLTGWQALLRWVQSDAQLAEIYLRLAETARALSGLHIFTFTEASIARYRALLALKLNVGEHGRAHRRHCAGRRRNGHHSKPARLSARFWLAGRLRQQVNVHRGAFSQALLTSPCLEVSDCRHLTPSLRGRGGASQRAGVGTSFGYNNALWQ